MNKLIISVGLLLISHQTFALKYMCSKAVRGNSGKYNSVKNQYEGAQRKGLLESKRAGFLSTIDAALNEIKNAKCPMDNPDVTKITNPLTELRGTIASATASASPEESSTDQAKPNTATVNTGAPAPTPAKIIQKPQGNSAPVKLSYPCRQTLKRQSGKPKDFERTLVPLREAVKNGKTIGNIQPGLEIEYKIDAAMSDLSSSQCPTNHPDFKVVFDQLEKQKKEVPEIYKVLKERLDAFGKKADVNNYPDYEKDTQIFEVISKRYNHASRLYDPNINFEWKDFGPNSKVDFRLNIKRPVYSFEALKSLLSSMRQDGEAYNSQMKLVETKYKELFNANRMLAGKYMRQRDNAAKILGGFYKENLEYLKKSLETSIQHNTKVIDLWTKESMEKRRAEFFRGDTLKNVLRDTNQAIELFALTSAENKEKAKSYENKMMEINKVPKGSN